MRAGPRLRQPLLTLSLIIAGCGGAGEYSAQTARPPAATADRSAGMEGMEATKPAEVAGEKRASNMPRRIIYNADVDLVVDSLSATEAEIMRLLKADGGYVSETEINAHPTMRRSATWRVRVPVDKFDGFLAAVVRLGELNRNHVGSQDVTEEYYDLEARIANKQQEEKRLQKHLADSTGKLEDILAVERELTRVRGEIEQGQGRLRFLANQTALSTVTITATELKGYKPPVSPTFTTRMGRTFRTSVQALIAFGEGVVLFAVALAPWIPVAAVVLLLVWLVVRHRIRRGAARAA